MREQGRPVRGRRRGAVGSSGNRPRPNQLTDEAKPNVLHLEGERSASHAGPTPVRSIDQPRSRRPSRSAAVATASDGEQEGQRSSPSLFTILVAGFVVINILRACLQAGG